MKDEVVSNMLAVLADSEARSTAMLVELVAATALFKLAPPQGDEVAEIEITQGDLAEAMAAYFYTASYDQDGTLKLRLSRDQDALDS